MDIQVKNKNNKKNLPHTKHIHTYQTYKKKIISVHTPL